MDAKGNCRDNHYGINIAPIGQAIKKARNEQNMTRESLAELVEYSVRQIQCTLPLVFALESVTGSFLQLYHYLVYKVCVSALRQQLIAVCKRSVENVPSFFCR